MLLFAPIVFYLLTSKKTPQITPERQKPISIPTIPDNINQQSYKINFKVKEESFDFPEKINIFTYEPQKIDEQELGDIAQNLSFTGEPIIEDDYYDGKIILYVNDQTYLTSSVEIGEIRYGLQNFPTINTKIDDQEIVQNAIDFLQSNNFTNSEENIITSINYYKIAPTRVDFEAANSENADIIQVNFTPNISEYPIIDLNPEKTMTYVQVMADGKIYSANTTRLDSIKTSQEVSLKNFQEVKKSINDSTIISINNGITYLESIPENTIQSIEIDKIDLAYFQASQKESIIQPIFLLEGTVTISTRQDPLPIVLYLPAISGN